MNYSPRYDVMTLFPDMLSSCLSQGVVGRALQKGLYSCSFWDIRHFSDNRHRRVDDVSFGGGPGMVMQPAPLQRCLDHIRKEREMDSRPAPVIYLSAQGDVFSQKKAQTLSHDFPEGFILLCGRYEGVDERFVQKYVDAEISIGDYVLTGGELPAMVVLDAVIRLIPGVLGNPDSVQYESFSKGLLDHPHYTHPVCFDGMDVPAVLRSGHHAQIDRWRLKQALGKTWLKRPDLLACYELSALEKVLLEEFQREYHQN